MLFTENSPIRKFKNPEARADSSPDPSSARTNAKNKLVSVLRKSISPENSFRKTESELKPRHTARISLRAEPQKEKCPFHFRKNPPPRNQESKEHFFFLGLPSEARRWRGSRGAYGLIYS